MKRMTRLLPKSLVCLAATAAACAMAGPASAATQPKPLLPNLFQSIPRELGVETDTSGLFPRYELGFASAVHNNGEGPLLIHSHRPDTSNPDMTADQIVTMSDGSRQLNAGVGVLRYTSSPTHQHWHYQRFETYELRRAGDDKLIGTDKKTGFCLQDSFDPEDETLPGEPEQPVYHDGCGYNSPDLLQVDEGISVGWTDIYDPIKEGQSVDLTDAPAGLYYLVHRTNVDRHIRELSYDDDQSSLLLEVAWPDGTGSQPTVKTLRSCYSSATCPAAKAPLTPTAAGRYARAALKAAVGHAARRLTLTCPHRASVTMRCHAAWRERTSRYAGSVTVASRFASGGGPEVAWSVSLKRRASACRSRCTARSVKRQGRLPVL